MLKHCSLLGNKTFTAAMNGIWGEPIPLSKMSGALPKLKLALSFIGSDPMDAFPEGWPEHTGRRDEWFFPEPDKLEEQIVSSHDVSVKLGLLRTSAAHHLKINLF